MTLFGKAKEAPLVIECPSHLGAIVFSNIASVRDMDRYQRYEGGLRQIADEIVDAAAHARLASPAVTDEQRQLCEAALHGERVSTNDGELVAQLVP
jgi:hypothetical protein